MATSLVKKISPGEFGPLIQTTKNAYVSGNLMIIQPKLGQVIFDFSSIRADTCVVRLRRDSGNGIMMINSNGLSRGHQINSRVSQSISFQLGGDRLIQIHRTNRSRGDISILDMSFYYEKKSAADWNNEIKKCDEYKCLRLIGDDLHASDGAYLKGNILHVETEPSGMFIKKDNVVKFLGSCKVIELEVEIESKQTPQEEVPVKNLEGPKVDDVKLSHKKPSSTNPLYIYDTNQSGFSPIFGSKDSVVNTGGVTLDRHGSYNIPLNGIDPNKKYSISVDVSRVDGNGKFMSNILPSSSDSIVKIASNEVKTFTFDVSPSSSSNYSLSVWRHPSSKGRIRVSRVIVSGGVEAVPLVEPIKTQQLRHIQDRSVPKPPESKPPESKKVQSGSPPVVLSYENDSVAKMSISFADHYIEQKQDAIPISISTVSGMLWLSKVQKLTKNFSLAKKAKISICSVENIQSASKIFLDSFKESQLNESVIEALKKADLIFTPTEQGVSALMDRLPDNGIRCLTRVWPYVDPVIVPFLNKKEFILVTNRNPAVTAHVIDSFPNERIVVIGARGDYPLNVVPINEYFPYAQLLWVLNRSKAVFDFHSVEDHKSGLLDLCMNLGTPVVTSSWHYMNFPHAIFLDGSESVSGWKLPAKEEIAESLKDAIGKGVVNIQAQRASFENFIKEML